MREILFRGKRVDNGEWITGYYIKANHHWHNQGIHEDWIVVDTIQNGGWCNVRGKYAITPETIGQYTGLTDKNGTKIFEGDIVLDHYYKQKGVVTFCQGTFDSGIYKYNGWVLKRANGKVEECELVVYEDNHFEVIGNVCDNPEILSN